MIHIHRLAISSANKPLLPSRKKETKKITKGKNGREKKSLMNPKRIFVCVWTKLTFFPFRLYLCFKEKVKQRFS